MYFPEEILHYIREKSYNIDNIGMSGAAVCIFDDLVLKVQEANDAAENEYKMLNWLEGKLPVPKIIEYTKTNKLSYILMNKCTGELACSDMCMSRPKQLSELIAETIYSIWSTNTVGCPVDQTLSRKLQQAQWNVANNLVDINDCEPETFGKRGFKSPEALLYWLQDNKPIEVPVLSHGDLCLPNIFFKDNKLSGLIDLGRSGTADKWCDIAICYRSMKHNYDGVYTGIKKYSFCEADFFDMLQIKPDWELMRYYLLLDELF